jgi:site-specific DNA-methyltransferase (adenine-specific)
MMDRFLNKVFHEDALQLLQALPTASVDAVISDPMYGIARKCSYEWGEDPARGDPVKHWLYHQPMYEECRRVLKPGGVLAWAQGFKFVQHFNGWFGAHKVWSPICTAHGLNFRPNTWVVQTREERPIDNPNNMIVRVDRRSFVPLKALHPCPKPLEELAFMIDLLTQPGHIILDCFCGLGSTLLAAEQFGRHWIGCDLSKRYCQIAMKRMAELLAAAPASNREPSRNRAGLP